MLKKITFENKEDIVNLNSDSKFVLTASNVNEIKDVVNSLSDDLDNRITISEIFRYFRFNIPIGLDWHNNSFYIIKLELSKFNDFSNVIEINCAPNIQRFEDYYENNYRSFPEVNNETYFKVFKNGSWKNVSDVIFTCEDEGAEVQIDLYEYIKDFGKNLSNFPFFGRYKLINLNGGFESEWNGFSLTFSNYNNELNFKPDYNRIEINGPTTIFGKNTYYYNVVAWNGAEKLNITDLCTFKVINENISTINNNALTTNDTIVNEIQVLTANCVINGFPYSAQLNINICPLKIVSYYIGGPEIIKEGEFAEYTVHGRLSNGDIIDLTNESEIVINSLNCTAVKKNGKIRVACMEHAYDNELFTLTVKCNSVNGYFTSIASKMITVEKTLYTTFKILRYDGDPQETKNNLLTSTIHSNDKIGDIGYMENSDYDEINFKAILFGPGLDEFNDPDNITVKEVGTSHLSIEKITLNEEPYFKLTLINKDNIEGKKDIILMVNHVDKISGKLTSGVYYVTAHVSAKANIKQIKLTLDRYLLESNSESSYRIYGISSLGEIIELNGLADIVINTPLKSVSIDFVEHKLKTGEILKDAAGYVKAVYNDLVTYEDVYFVGSNE